MGESLIIAIYGYTEQLHTSYVCTLCHSDLVPKCSGSPPHTFIASRAYVTGVQRSSLAIMHTIMHTLNRTCLCMRIYLCTHACTYMLSSCLSGLVEIFRLCTKMFTHVINGQALPPFPGGLGTFGGNPGDEATYR